MAFRLALPGLRHRAFPTLSTSPRLSQSLVQLSIPSQRGQGRQQQARGAANQVSNRPASQNVDHASTNALEEARAVAGTIAKGIAGDPTAVTREGHASSSSEGHLSQDFSSITSAIAAQVPKHIFTFGLLGAAPYIGASASTLYLANQAGQASQGVLPNVDVNQAIEVLHQVSHIQVTYGAVLISFIGALHWGFEFAKYNGYQGYPRLILGVAPLLAAWPTLYLDAQLALVAQWFIFTGIWYADSRATTAGWTPAWYSQYRFYLSILVGTCIVGTLFGLNYLGPTTDVALTKDLKEMGVLGSGLGYMDFAVHDDSEARKHQKPVLPAGSEFTISEGDETYHVLVSNKKEEEDEDEEGEGKEGGEASEGEGEKEKSDDDSEGEKKSEDGSDEKKDDEGSEDKEGDDSAEKKGEGDGGKGKGTDDSKPGENSLSAVNKQAEQKEWINKKARQ